MYRGSSCDVWNCKSRIVLKLVVVYCWGVVWVLSITVFFVISARIDQEALSSNYWKYLVGSDILATCSEWSALCAHYFIYQLSWSISSVYKINNGWF